jgi:glycolate oxidase FAD binding subunit
MGGGTHGGIGSPVAADLVITTRKMASIIDWQPDDLTVVVGAGMVVDDLEDVLSERRQTAVLPESVSGATVGGVIAVGLSGYRRLRYGPTRDRVLRVEMATGYGSVITGGSLVVKSSTGYGVPRLVVGSMGTLGLVGTVALKLWAQPMTTTTVRVPDAATVLDTTYRPLAVLETPDGSFCYLSGTAEQVASQTADLAVPGSPGLAWPDPIDESIRLSVRVPPRDVSDTVSLVRELGSSRWVAEHGVGIVTVGFEDLDGDAFGDLRSWAESRSGSLVVLDGAGLIGDGVDPWGPPPSSFMIQRRIKESFDPSGICNPGVLPGGL